MACGLVLIPAMPVDTLLPLGASPPMPSLFFSHRCAASSAMYIADHSAVGWVKPATSTKKLRPCLREGPKKLGVRDPANRTDSNSNRSGLDLDIPGDATSSSSLASAEVRPRGRSAGNSAKARKSVCFADTKGLALEDVRIMDGPSCMPPLLKSRILQEIVQDEQAELFPTYTYVADFEQPAANYLEFRHKLEHSFVSLENALIRDNDTVIGTIKVKNIAFEKAVAVRATFNKWSTYQDVPAVYVAGSPSSQKDRYDSFSFAFAIPPNMEGDSFEFCIQFTSGGKTYWDSRNGQNYRIVSQHERSLTEQQKIASYYSLSSKANWGEFSYWKVKDDERPYW